MFLDMEKYESYMMRYHADEYTKIEDSFKRLLNKLKDDGFEILECKFVPFLQSGKAYFYTAKKGAFFYNGFFSNPDEPDIIMSDPYTSFKDNQSYFEKSYKQYYDFGEALYKRFAKSTMVCDIMGLNKG